MLTNIEIASDAGSQHVDERKPALEISDLILCAAEKYQLSRHPEDCLFLDADWYAARYLSHFDPKPDPLKHFLITGQFKDYSPNPLFDSEWYRSRNTDVAEAGLTSIYHYLKFGHLEDRSPNPLFDSQFYRHKANGEGILFPNLLFHYICVGDRAGLSPHRFFDLTWFKAFYHVDAETTALSFYLTNVRKLSLNPNPIFYADQYNRKNLDVLEGSVDAFSHYILYGDYETRSPSIIFDVAYYRSEAGSDIGFKTAFEHYAHVGDHSGVNPHPLFDNRWYREKWGDQIPSGMTALEHCLRNFPTKQFPVNPSLHLSDMFFAALTAERATIFAAFEAAPLRSSPQKILLVNHTLGGGTHTYVYDLARRIQDEGNHALLFEYCTNTHFAFLTDLRSPLPSRVFNLSRSTEELDHAVRDVTLVHVNQLLGASDTVRDMSKRLGVPMVVTIHDFYWFCPRITMLMDDEQYCGGASAKKCDTCVYLFGTHESATGEWQSVSNAGAWQTRNKALLLEAEKIIAPSLDAANRLREELGVQAEVKYHPLSPAPIRPAPLPSSGPYRFAVIGAIGYHKGFKRLLQCVREAFISNRNIEFVVVGVVPNVEKLKKFPNVRISGRYPDGFSRRMLELEEYNGALFLSPWPETYSYTLTEAVQAGLFPITLDIGAIPERIRNMGWGLCIPQNSTPSQINLALELVGSNPTTPPFDLRLEGYYKTISGDYYGIVE